jgi:hypothetical protein
MAGLAALLVLPSLSVRPALIAPPRLDTHGRVYTSVAGSLNLTFSDANAINGTLLSGSVQLR